MQDTDSDRELDDDERLHVNNALQAILATEKFEAAPQMSAFLRYVVEQASAGNQSRIKAFTVAVDALGKPETFDPQNDPVVRVLAGRLRATLTAYNEEHPNAPVKITMTKGSYVPRFQRQQSGTDKPDRNKALNAAVSDIDKPINADSERRDVHPDEPDSAQLHGATGSSLQPRPPTSDVAIESSASADGRRADNASPDSAMNGSSGITLDASTMSRIAQAVDAIPKHVYIAMLLAVIAVTLLTNIASGRGKQEIPPINSSGFVADRSRPDGPCIFINAKDQGDPLENSLNTLLSSVISENTDLAVYRILDQNQGLQYWPEDYLLELATLKLPGETRVHLQLVEAVTGLIIHSEMVSLNPTGSEQFSSSELTDLIDATRSMIIEEGPLLQHYVQRTASR